MNSSDFELVMMSEEQSGIIPLASTMMIAHWPVSHGIVKPAVLCGHLKFIDEKKLPQSLWLPIHGIVSAAAMVIPSI
jgi:hypothetical protein